MLLNDILGFFEGLQLRTFVDGTLGAGGHACAIAAAHQVHNLTAYPAVHNNMPDDDSIRRRQAGVADCVQLDRECFSSAFSTRKTDGFCFDPFVFQCLLLSCAYFD